MKNLQIIEHNGQRILTTQQLAEIYETSTDNIKKNFSNHKVNFIEGKHYYLLKGNLLKEFKENLRVNNIHLQISNMTRNLYLWTERGANRHCKILDTDKAWEQFDYLEDTYFKVKEKCNNILTISEAIKINSILSKSPKERLPMLIFVFEKAGINISKNVVFDFKQNSKNSNISYCNQNVINFLKGYDVVNKVTSNVYNDFKDYCHKNCIDCISHIEFSKQVNRILSMKVEDKWLNGKKCRIFVSTLSKIGGDLC